MGGAPPSPLGSEVPGEGRGRCGGVSTHRPLREGSAASLSVRAALLRAGSRGLWGRSTSVTAGPQTLVTPLNKIEGIRQKGVGSGFIIFS